ncbi:MAG: hypothetical protein LBQ54_02690 [Planctomycetaceae bacterium]|jgi:hypothetical protein|nr:hypothetical protein [Planctomycetaceae bacterium]
MKYCCFVVLLFVPLRVPMAVSQEFRVENTVNSGGKTTKGVTVFKEGVIYDFILPNGEITLFDRNKQEFYILDPALRLQTSVKPDDLKQQVDELQFMLERVDSPFLNFVASPAFDETGYEPESGLMVFRSLWLDYEFTTRVFDDQTIAKEYFDYLLWFSRLNFRLSPSAVSALVRAGLNPYFEKNNRFPEKVTVKLYPKGKKVLSSTTIQADSSHLISKRLTDAETSLLKQAEQYRQSFTAVPLDDYQKEMKKKIK